MATYNPDSPSSIEHLFSTEGDALNRADFKKPNLDNSENQQEFRQSLAHDSAVASNNGEE
jgi:hypothetical protein